MTLIRLPIALAKGILSRARGSMEVPETCPECGEYRAPDWTADDALHCAGCTIGQLEDEIAKAERTPELDEGAFLDGHKANFEALRTAFLNGSICLAECRDATTGAKVATVCAVETDDEGGEMGLVPFARMFDGNPYDQLVPPGDPACTPEAGGCETRAGCEGCVVKG